MKKKKKTVLNCKTFCNTKHIEKLKMDLAQYEEIIFILQKKQTKKFLEKTTTPFYLKPSDKGPKLTYNIKNRTLHPLD